MNVVSAAPSPRAVEGGHYKIIISSFTNGNTPADHDHDYQLVSD